MIKNNKITLRIYDEKIDTIDCKDNFLIDEDKEFKFNSIYLCTITFELIL